MTAQTVFQKARRNLDALALAIAVLTAVGYRVISPTAQIEQLQKDVTEIKVVAPAQKIEQLQKDVAEIRGYAEAAAVDLCLSRPDSTLARMRLNCRALLSR